MWLALACWMWIRNCMLNFATFCFPNLFQMKDSVPTLPKYTRTKNCQYQPILLGKRLFGICNYYWHFIKHEKLRYDQSITFTKQQTRKHLKCKLPLLMSTLQINNSTFVNDYDIAGSSCRSWVSKHVMTQFKSCQSQKRPRILCPRLWKCGNL